MSKSPRAAFVAAVCIGVAAIAGCASQQAGSVQQRIAAACPVVQAAVADVQAMGGSLPQATQDKVNAAVPVITQICTGNAQLDTATVQSMVQTGIPALIADVNATSLPADQKVKVATALTLAQIALTTVLQLAPEAKPAT